MACFYRTSMRGDKFMKAALYCRLSEEDRNKLRETDDSESIQNQKTMLLQHAMEKGWEIYNIYSDDNYTGADRNRPAFNQLLQDAESHRFDIVLCKTQSRFTRELELVERYIHGLFPIWGIRFVSIVDNTDTEVKGNKKARQINGLINEWYLEDMSENIRGVLTSRRKNGFHIGAFALYGYQKDPDRKGHLIIDEEAAAVVREVFTLFSQGHGKTAIARMLNDRRIPNPTEYKRQKGLRYKQPTSRNSTLWRYFAISDMLTNEIYIGNLVQGRYGSVSYKTKQNKPLPPEKWIRVEGTHKPIVDRELWDRVQELVAQRTKPFAVGTIGLFAKKAVCAHCGYTMRSSKNRGLYYLKCATRHAAKDACVGSFLSVNTLEKMVLLELHQIVDEYLDRDELERKVTLESSLADRIARLTKDAVLYEKKLSEYTKGIKDLYLDKVKGTITDQEYTEMAADFRRERDRLEQVATATRSQAEELEEQLHSGQNQRHLLEEYLEIERLNRETVDKLIEKIVIGKRAPDSRQVPVEIYWTF